MYNSIYEIERKNQNIGHHFFDADSKRFFSSRILSDVYKNCYFITSERNGFDDYTRSFTVRMALNSGSIETIGGFNRFPTKAQAKRYIKDLPDELPEFIEASDLFWNKDNKQVFFDLTVKHPQFIDYIKANHKDLKLTTLFGYPVKEAYKIELEY